MTLDSVAEAIRNASDFTTEVVLINNGSTDDTQLVIEQWGLSMAFPVTTVLEPRKGLSRARNAGIKASSGKTLVFTDDDCSLNPDYLIMLNRHYVHDTSPVMRGGKVELGNADDMPFTIKLTEREERMNDLHFPGGFLLGCNMAIRREIIDSVGHFDERFGAGAVFKAAEDADYIHRVYRAGFVVEYSPDVIVKHFHGRKTKESIISLNRGYHLGNGALFAKHITDWRLLRHFYWSLRKYLTGELQDEAVGFTFGPLILGNIKGGMLYFIRQITSGTVGYDYGKRPDHR